ncbi:MAG TPA: rhodanese-like domain-containing protein, partial [Pseudonocardiaceae bacterium]|nr:rhodanese-like domain-containing protein [Pseudonocardiaceae bacterium]
MIVDQFYLGCVRDDQAFAAAQRIATMPDLQVVDVRGPGEFAGGTLPGAVNLPLPRLRELMPTLDP